MKFLVKMSFLVIALGLFVGCASMSPHMTVVTVEKELKPEPGKALLIFLRPSNYGGAVQATIYDDTAYIATVSGSTKFAYQADPGKHMFMVIGESADFMRADLIAGKTYYAQVAARMGIWKARFSFIPLNGQVSDGDLSVWLKETALTETNQLGHDWAKSNRASILEKHVEYIQDWNSKAETDKQTLAKTSGK